MKRTCSAVTTDRGKRGAQSAPHGFTLIEVLVVLVILAVLAAIVLPVFAHVRENGRRTTCTSNLRQIAAAMQQYIQDYDGMYPTEMFVYKTNGVTTEVSWQEVLLPYTKSREVFHCATHPVTKLNARFTYDSYEINDERLNTFTVSGRSVAHGKHEAQLPFPATTWLNVDESSVDENHRCVNCEGASGSCGRYFVGSTLHSGGGNYSFVDGHVKWHTPEAMAEIECTNAPVPF